MNARWRWGLMLCIGLITCACAFAETDADTIPRYDGREPDMSKPVQVFILLGQSNMLGFGRTFGNSEGFLEYAVREKGLYPYLVDEEGNWVTRRDVRNVRVMNERQLANAWMTITRGNIGPEIGIGHHLGNAIDAPVLILKSCIGNRSLGWDLLPPGSEQFEFEGRVYPGYKESPESWRVGTEPNPIDWYAGKQYDSDVAAARRVLDNLEDYIPGATAYEVAGFFWWQGDKDMRNTAHSTRYEQNLVRLIRTLREEFDAPDARFVAATLGQTTMETGGNQGLIRDAKFALADPEKHPEFAGTYAVVYTHPLSKGGSSSGHYNRHAETYMNVGEAMGRAMVELLEDRDGGHAGAASVSAGRRPPRRISPENFATIQQHLRYTLAALSNAGNLREIPLQMHSTTANVWLKEAQDDGTMTFGVVGGDRTATVSWAGMSQGDQAVLAMLAAHLRPNDRNAQGMAGVYMELMRHTETAEEFFRKAGTARAQWEGLLQ